MIEIINDRIFTSNISSRKRYLIHSQNDRDVFRISLFKIITKYIFKNISKVILKVTTIHTAFMTHIYFMANANTHNISTVDIENLKIKLTNLISTIGGLSRPRR